MFLHFNAVLKKYLKLMLRIQDAFQVFLHFNKNFIYKREFNKTAQPAFALLQYSSRSLLRENIPIITLWNIT
jgi:hypothetical protein